MLRSENVLSYFKPFWHFLIFNLSPSLAKFLNFAQPPSLSQFIGVRTLWKHRGQVAHKFFELATGVLLPKHTTLHHFKKKMKTKLTGLECWVRCNCLTLFSLETLSLHLRLNTHHCIHSSPSLWRQGWPVMVMFFPFDTKLGKKKVHLLPIANWRNGAEWARTPKQHRQLKT